MALASVLERPLSVNRRGFFGLGGRADLLDLGPGSPSDGLSLATPSWGVPEEPRIEILHGTTTLAFKVQTQPPCRAESRPPAPFPASQRVQNPRGRGREAQAEARASCPDPGSFAVSLSREASVLALAGAGWRWGWGIVGVSGRRISRLFRLIPRRPQAAPVQERGGRNDSELWQREGCCDRPRFWKQWPG